MGDYTLAEILGAAVSVVVTIAGAVKWGVPWLNAQIESSQRVRVADLELGDRQMAAKFRELESLLSAQSGVIDVLRTSQVNQGERIYTLEGEIKQDKKRIQELKEENNRLQLEIVTILRWCQEAILAMRDAGIVPPDIPDVLITAFGGN